TDLVDARQRPTARDYPHQLTEQEKAHILAVCNTPEHQSLPPSQIVPKLADQGIYVASESSFYRVLKVHGQLNRRGNSAAPKPAKHPTTWVASGPNQVWSWDITFLPSAVRGHFHRLYMITDVYSRLIVGWEIHSDESAAHAAQLIGKACLRHGVRQDQLVLHSDNGSPMKGATMLATLQKLGIVPSFSRPSVSNDNAYSEALFKTLKYAPGYPAKPFTDITQARLWVQGFAHWYNHTHRHSGIKFVTPWQRHVGQDVEILKQRHAVYEAAKRTQPQRWKGRKTRNWNPINEVKLNPCNDQTKQAEELKLAA
ncbi:IS3 family transposase, partial [Alcaligenaceae bacterium]|nr:IS3 family transposase [Alcaligenaceae bacterium]